MNNPSNGPKFTFGKYRGMQHKHVAEDNPSYIVWAYENVQHHGGIEKALYDQARKDLDFQSQERESIREEQRYSDSIRTPRDQR